MDAPPHTGHRGGERELARAAGAPEFAAAGPEAIVGLAYEHYYPGDGIPEYEITLALRRWDYKFVPTWFSALMATGRPVDDVAEAEVGMHRRRRERFAELESAVSGEIEGLSVLKGLQIAACYPPGLERYVGDLDLHAETEESLWEAARLLAGRGWEVEGLTAFPVDGAPQYWVALARPTPALNVARDHVDLTTVAWPGDRMGVPARRQLGAASPRALATVQVAAEGLDRPFGLRDLIDAWAILRRCDPAEVDQTVALATRLGVTGEARELFEGLDREGLSRGLAALLPSGRGLAGHRASRAATAARRLARPRRGAALRLLQHRRVHNDLGPLGRRLWSRERRLNFEEGMRQGVMLFGVMAQPDRRTGERAEAQPGTPLLSTPLGTFLMSPVDHVSEEWFHAHSAEPAGGVDPS